MVASVGDEGATVRCARNAIRQRKLRRQLVRQEHRRLRLLLSRARVLDSRKPVARQRLDDRVLAPIQTLDAFAVRHRAGDDAADRVVAAVGDENLGAPCAHRDGPRVAEARHEGCRAFEALVAGAGECTQPPAAPGTGR